MRVRCSDTEVESLLQARERVFSTHHGNEMSHVHRIGGNPCIMRMGNYMRVGAIPISVMAATDSRPGMRHLTVVPTNFEPPEDNGDSQDEEN